MLLELSALSHVKVWESRVLLAGAGEALKEDVNFRVHGLDQVLTRRLGKVLERTPRLDRENGNCPGLGIPSVAGHKFYEVLPM